MPVYSVYYGDNSMRAVRGSEIKVVDGLTVIVGDDNDDVKMVLAPTLPYVIVVSQN